MIDVHYQSKWFTDEVWPEKIIYFVTMKTFQTRINLISRCWSFYQELDTAAALEMQEDGGAFTIGPI